MSVAATEVEDILQRMRVSGRPGLFVLGCFEKPSTLYMQQVRALNLVYALRKTTDSNNASVAVIGAGAGGITAALAASIIGWRVSIFDTLVNDVLSFAGADTNKRWLHPHIYDWPAQGKERDDAGLPILNWAGAEASEVIAGLRAQWRRLTAIHKVDTHLGVSDLSLLQSQGGHLVSWNGNRTAGATVGAWGARQGRRIQMQHFDIVVLAVGFGIEKPTSEFPSVVSYWAADNIDVNQAATNGPRHVLVSGNGDGGLIEILRLSFPKFRHHQVLQKLRDEWLGEAALARVRQALLEIEADARAALSRREPYDVMLNQRYRALADSLVFNSPLSLRDDVIPILTSRSPLPLTLESAPLNRFLFSLTNAQYVRGPIKAAIRSESDQKFRVTFEARGKLELYDDVIVRHGPESALRACFPEIYKDCEPLRTLAAESVDRSREPRFDRTFAEVWANAARDAEPPPDPRGAVLSEAVDVAIRGDFGIAAFARYRQAIEAEWDGQFEGPDAPKRFVSRSVRRLAPQRDLQPDPAKRARSGGSEIVDERWIVNGPMCRMLIGEAGAGKSMLLKFLLRQLVRNERFFPVLISLPTVVLEATSVLTIARQALLAKIDDAPERQALARSYDTRVLQGAVIVLADGFDELASEAQARFQQLLGDDDPTALGGNRLLIAGRDTTTFTDPSMPAYQLLAPSVRQVALAMNLGPSSEEHGETTQFMWSFMNTLLWTPFLAAGTYVERIRVFVELELRNVKDFEEARVVLRKLAWRSWLDRASFDAVTVRATIAECIGGEPADLESLEASVLACSLIARTTGTDAQPMYQFVHRTLQEFLVAEHISFAGGIEQILWLGQRAEPAAAHLAAMAVAMISAQEQQQLYATLQQLPESLDFAVLTFRVACARYAGGLLQSQIEQLAEEVTEFASNAQLPMDDAFFRVASHVTHAAERFHQALLPRLSRLLENADKKGSIRVLRLLGPARMPGTVRVVAPVLLVQDEDLREAAAEALGECEDESAIPLLNSAYLTSQGRMVFQGCVRAMANIGGTRASVALNEILQNRALFRNFRWPAAEALGQIGDENAERALSAVLNDESDLVRAAAARALGKMNSSTAADSLVCMLQDREVSVRIAAADSLARLDTVEKKHALAIATAIVADDHTSVRTDAARALRKIDPAQTLQILRDLLNGNDASRKADAITLMVEQVGSEVLETALLLSRSREERVALAAATALQSIPHERSTARLQELLQHESADIRGAAINGLSNHGSTASVPAIIRCVEAESDGLVQTFAMQALGNLRDARAVPPLIRAVEKNAPFAALALGKLGDPTAIPALAAAWFRTLKSRLNCFALPIGRIGGPEATRALRELFALATDGQLIELIEALGETHDSGSIPCLLIALGSDNSNVSSHARYVLGKRSREQIASGLSDALLDSHGTVRRQAVMLAPFYANAAMAERLATLSLSDPDPAIAQGAQAALNAYELRKRAMGPMPD